MGEVNFMVYINPEFLAKGAEIRGRISISELTLLEPKLNKSMEQLLMIVFEKNISESNLIELEKIVKDYHKLDAKAVIDWDKGMVV